MNYNVSDAELDAMLADWGSTARSVAGHQPMPELTSRTRRFGRSRQPRPARHLGWQVAAGAVAVALAAAIVIGLPNLLDHDRRAAGPLPGVTSVTSIVPAPPGSKVVTFHGLSITVPASWPVTGYTCGLTSSVVELPGFTTLCGRGPHPEFTIVSFHEGAPSKEGVTRTSRTTIGGLAATRFDIEPPRYGVDRTAVGYEVPQLQAWVMIEPAQGQSGQELAASLRVDEVDVHGCRSTATAAEVAQFPSSATSDRAGMAQALIPGRPESASVCRYRAGWLEQGKRLSGPELAAFTATLNKLPRGLSRAIQRVPVKCRQPGTLGSLDDKDLDADLDVYRIEVRYPNGPPVVLIAKLGECGDLGISNGARTGQRTDALMVSLLQIVRAGSGVPARVSPAPE